MPSKKPTPRERILQSQQREIDAAVKRAAKTGRTADPAKSVPTPKVSKRKIVEPEGRPRGGFYGGMTRDKGK